MSSDAITELESIYENIEQDDIFQLLNYKADYLVNVDALIKECEEKPLEMESSESHPLDLLKELRNPRYMDPITKQYHQYFDNIKFTYLEQNAKEKFLKNIVSSKFITLDEIDRMEQVKNSNKKMLQDNKKARDSLLEDISKKLHSNYTVYQEIKRLQNDCKQSLKQSCDFLRKIEQLEDENIEYSQSIDKADEEVLQFVHKLNDYETVINEAKEESFINESVISNFDDFVLINSKKNLTALTNNRKRTCQELAETHDTLLKKIKLKEDILREKSNDFNKLISKNQILKDKIDKLNNRNQTILESAKQNKTENVYENRKFLMLWLHELEKFLKKFDKAMPNSATSKWGISYDYDTERQVYTLTKPLPRGNNDERIKTNNTTERRLGSSESHGPPQESLTASPAGFDSLEGLVLSL